MSHPDDLTPPRLVIKGRTMSGYGSTARSVTAQPGIRPQGQRLTLIMYAICL